MSVLVEAFGDVDAPRYAVEDAQVSGARESRRREHATVRACARRVLTSLGHSPAPILTDTDGAPEWPSGVVGSLTHCDDYRAAILAPASELAGLGIDAQPHAGLDAELWEHILNPDERLELTALAAVHADVHWDRIAFCAKEAAYKAWFPRTRRWLDFTDVRTTVRPDGTFIADVPTPDLPTAADGRRTLLAGRRSRRQAGRGHRCGTGHGFAVYFAAAYPWLPAGSSFIDLYLRVVVVGGGAVVGAALLPILAKWLLVGRWRVVEFPVWGPAYLRFWTVKTLLRTNPLMLAVGTPLYAVHLRALGADIGPRRARPVPAPYRVAWTGPARRDMARLPGKVAAAILTYVDERLAQNPARMSKPQHHDLAGYRSPRNGDYRVLIRLDDTNETVWVVRIHHRAHLYRPRGSSSSIG
ncbi:MAG: 4'-phosphopantetheinyl transferase superfamily protein [Nocardioidaceae bacterium]